MRNTALLESTMQHILDNPDQHDQQSWIRLSSNSCGTAACFAGWSCLLSGYEQSHWFPTSVRQPAGESVHIYEKAVELLGITSDEADCLFDGGNTVPMLELMVKDLVNGDQMRENSDYYEMA